MLLTPTHLPDLSSPHQEDQWLEKLLFVDLETTGARAGFDRITEIGLVWYSVSEGWQSASSLVNPDMRIPDNISQLTGISNTMVKDAPPFAELLTPLQALLKDRVIVAHNVRFDYGFLSREMARCDQLLGQRHLCTVRISRLLQPEQEKHNLAILVKRWGLTLNNHHRALDDALALAQLWLSWQQHFGAAALNQLVPKAIREVHLPPHLNQQDLSRLPEGPGVYLFYGDNDNLLYIGKSISLRARVFSHFSEALHNSREARMVQQTRHIDFICCAGDLGAQLLESQLIKQRQPIYNRRLRGSRDLHSWQLKPDVDGYLVPELVAFDRVPLNQISLCYGLFSKPSDARKALEGITTKSRLCKVKTGLEQRNGACFGWQLKQCDGACCGAESAERYNLRLQLAFSSLEIARWPFDGALCIAEHSDINDRHQWHLLYQWRYLGSTERSDQCDELLKKAESTAFDMDTYRILQRQLRHIKPEQAQVIPVPPT